MSEFLEERGEDERLGYNVRETKGAKAMPWSNIYRCVYVYT